MKIVLIEMVDKLGKTGDVVEVKKGFARNYLIPKKLAIPATEGAVKMVEMLKTQRVKKAMKTQDEALKLKELIEGKSITAKVKASDQGKLYGSVSERDITKMLEEQHGINLDFHNIVMDEHIKMLGNHSVKIRLHSEIELDLPVWVVREEEPE